MPRVAVVFLGGTIASVVDPVAGGNVPSLDAAAILARTPGIDEIAEVEPIDLGRTPASHFSFGRLIEIFGVVADRLADPGVDGAVVVQGTDSIEETAFCWDLLHAGSKPIVVTGAMRSASEAGFDGPANLRDAIRCAASAALRDAGVVVVLAGSIDAADDVAKTHASSLTTFRSPNAGPLGSVVGSSVVVWRRRVARRQVATSRASERVHLVTAVVGIDGSLIDGAMAAGAEGIVVAATGAGNTSPALLAAAERAMAAGIPVVLTTRALAGRAGTGYAFPGGGATWARAGAIVAGHLSGPKARVALALGIGAGLDGAGLAALLADPEVVA
jgi:L-asparaginase